MNKDVIKKWLNLKFFELKLCLFKSKRTTINVIKLIINKELLKFGVDYDYIVKNQKININQYNSLATKALTAKNLNF